MRFFTYMTVHINDETKNSKDLDIQKSWLMQYLKKFESSEIFQEKVKVTVDIKNGLLSQEVNLSEV